MDRRGHLGRERLLGFGEVASAVADGRMVGAGGGPGNEEPSGLDSGGFVVNCPIVAEF